MIGLAGMSSSVCVAISVGVWYRGLYILKSRGMNHSNQVREFLITDKGVELVDVYAGKQGVLTGGARLSMLAQEKALDIKTQEDIELRHLAVENKRNILDARIAEMRAEFAAQEAANITLSSQEKLRSSQLSIDKSAMRKMRGSDARELATKRKGKSKWLCQEKSLAMLQF